MGKNLSTFLSIEDLFKTENLDVLRNASSVQPDQLLAICNVLGSFLASVQQDEDISKKVLAKLSTASGKIIFQKLMVTFVWYYSQYLYRKYNLNKDAFKESDCTAIVKGLQSEASENKLIYSLFNEIQSGRHTSVVNSPFDKNGYNDSSTLLNRTIEDDTVLKKVNLTTKTIGAPLTVDQLLNSTEIIRKMKKGPAPIEKNDVDVLSKILNTNDSEAKGLKEFLALRTIEGIYSRCTDKKIDVKLTDKDKEKYPFLSDEKTFRSVQKAFQKFESVDANNYQDFLVAVQNSIKNKNESIEDNGGSIEDFASQLAMNMANYMTGKISAQEFQRIDRNIRDSQGYGKEVTLNETE